MLRRTTALLEICSWVTSEGESFRTSTAPACVMNPSDVLPFKQRLLLLPTELGPYIFTRQGFVHSRADDDLSKVHNKGVLHGDVALKNIVVGSEREVKVNEFGHAAVVDPKDPTIEHA